MLELAEDSLGSGLPIVTATTLADAASKIVAQVEEA